MTEKPSYDRDNWYDRHGISRPTHIPFMTDEELEKKFAQIRSSTVHGNWTQQGNRLTCNKCELRHSDIIPTNYLLQGTDERGLPIFKKL